MSKVNLNEMKDDIGAAALMVYGAVAGCLSDIDPDCSDLIEVALNIRQFQQTYYARWECRWKDKTHDKIHTSHSPLFTRTQHPMVFFEELMRLKKLVIATRKALLEEDNQPPKDAA